MARNEADSPISTKQDVLGCPARRSLRSSAVLNKQLRLHAWPVSGLLTARHTCLQKVLEQKKDDLRELEEKTSRLLENAAREAYAAVRQNNLAMGAQSQVDLLALTMTTARPHLVKCATRLASAADDVDRKFSRSVQGVLGV